MESKVSVTFWPSCCGQEITTTWSCTGALFSVRGSMNLLPWTLVSVRNGRLWNVTRN